METTRLERMVMALVLAGWLGFGSIYVSSQIDGDLGDLRCLVSQSSLSSQRSDLHKPVSGRELLEYIDKNPQAMRRSPEDLASFRRQLQTIGDRSYIAVRGAVD